jgi:hypothetical protein
MGTCSGSARSRGRIGLFNESGEVMWRPTELGDIVAERELMLRRKGHRARIVRVRFGRPTRGSNSDLQDPWLCPILITGFGKARMTSIAGEDSLQALILALEFVVRILRILWEAGRRSC